MYKLFLYGFCDYFINDLVANIFYAEVKTCVPFKKYLFKHVL